MLLTLMVGLVSPPTDALGAAAFVGPFFSKDRSVIK